MHYADFLRSLIGWREHPARALLQEHGWREDPVADELGGDTAYTFRHPAHGTLVYRHPSGGWGHAGRRGRLKELREHVEALAGAPVLAKARAHVRAYQRTTRSGQPVQVGHYEQERAAGKPSPQVGDTLHYTGQESGQPKSGVVHEVGEGHYLVKKPSGFVAKVLHGQVTGHEPAAGTASGPAAGKPLPPGPIKQGVGLTINDVIDAVKKKAAGPPQTAEQQAKTAAILKKLGPGGPAKIMLGGKQKTAPQPTGPPANPQHLLHLVSQATGMEPGAVIAALTAERADPGHTDVAAARAKIASAIFEGGFAMPDAAGLLMDQAHDPAKASAFAASITKGDAARAAKEYAQTPLYDLQVLGGVRLETKPVHGQANCQMATRVLTMGSTSVTGDFRHELGHAIRAAMGGDLGGKTALTKAAAAEYELVKQKVASNPEGAKEKLSHDWYETHYGIIGRRGLDSWEELAAEQYRGYHKALYQDRFEGGAGQKLAQYRTRFPGWARIWDAHYSAALLGALAQKAQPTPTSGAPASLSKSEAGADGWFGVDLDGTLAEQGDGFLAEIGPPVPAMIHRVRGWLAEGRDVRVFTARVAHDPGGAQRRRVQDWCEQHLGARLPVTCAKDHEMAELWDDRAIQVQRNAGIPVAAWR